MSRTRIRIVTGRAARRGARRGFVVGSLMVHVLLVALALLLPELFGRAPSMPHASLVVDLVGAPPAAAAATAAAPASEPSVPQTPPEGVTVEQPPRATPRPTPAAERPPATPRPTPEATPSPPPVPATGSAASGDRPTATGATDTTVAGSASSGASVAAFEGGDAAFAWYRASVTNALYSHWQRPILSGIREPLEVRVAFEIMRDGNVRGLRIEVGSGVPMLDRSALRAVGDAAPLPPLPAAMRDPYLPASFVFRLYPEGA